MTPEIVIPIFEELEKWDSIGDFDIGNSIIVPASRADIIRKTQTQQEQKRQAAEYYVNINPDASWGYLARMIYWQDEERAINVFKAQLPIPKGNQCDCVLSVWVQSVVTVCTVRGLTLT